MGISLLYITQIFIINNIQTWYFMCINKDMHICIELQLMQNHKFFVFVIKV